MTKTAHKRTGYCFRCMRDANPSISNNPVQGRLATGQRLDYRDTYRNGEYRRIVFRGYICEMHATQEDIVSIRYL
jgi:hypothetical protein